jgi:hypothetical protein
MMRGNNLVALLWGLAVLGAVVYLAAHGAAIPIVLTLMTFLPRRLEVGSTRSSRPGLDTTNTPEQR